MSTTVENVTAIGFLSFFVWTVAMGVVPLRRSRVRAARPEASSVDETVTA